MIRPNGYWNGENKAWIRRVIVRVGVPERPTWWSASYEGTERAATEVWYDGAKPFYLDDQGGEGGFVAPGAGWRKCTMGLGSPQYGHMSLPDTSFVVKVLWQPQSWPKDLGVQPEAAQNFPVKPPSF